MDKILAKICTCCPFCVARRRWPESLYGRVMTAVEKRCPFCRAYDRCESASRDDAAHGDGREGTGPSQ